MSDVPIDPTLLAVSDKTANPECPQKRKADLSEGLSAAPISKKTKNVEKGNSDSERYGLVGKKLVCLGHPFGSPRIALNVGLKFDSGNEGNLDMEETELLRQLDFYNMILLYAPTLEDDIKTRGRLGPKELQDICRWITKGMGEQRSTDLGAIKHAGLAYLMPANQEALKPPIGKKEDKSDRGFNHQQLARMLCPRKKLASFDEDPETITGALQEGQIKVTESNWPTIFYEDGVYDPDDRLKGLFCGHAAFRFYLHLFIGPTAAETDTVIGNPSRPSKNRTWGLTKVTPGIIAYVHVMLYFTLTTAPRWCVHVGQVNLDEMASLIVEMFAQPDNWTRSTLEWWNSRAFPKSSTRNNNGEESDDDITAIRAQRAGHAAKKKGLTNAERRAEEGREFGTPPPEENGSKSDTGTSSTTPGASSESESGTGSTMSTSVTSLSTTPAIAEDSELSSVPSDNEGGSAKATDLKATTTSTLQQDLPMGAVKATEMTSNKPVPGPTKPKKKGPNAKKPRTRKNGF